jgi:hypothetical protein
MKYSDRHISDEELDQLFRDAHASEGPEALFVPEFWSEMEAMLPAEPVKKRGFYWIPLASALVLVGIVLFYPPNPVKIEHITYKQNEKTIHNDQSQLIQNGLNKEENAAVIAENTTMPVSEKISEKQQIKTTFRSQKRQPKGQGFDNQRNTRLTEEPTVGKDNTLNIPENKTLTSESDPLSVSLPIAIGTDNSDFVRLEPRYERVPHEEIAPLPKQKSHESNEWFVEFGPTVGQSPYFSPNQKRNVVTGAVFGGGYTKRIDNAYVSFGLQARLEGFGGLEYRETNFTPNIVRTVSVKQLYSLEVPLKFGYTLGRSEFAVGVVPGIQLFIHGKERITENQIVKREDSFTGKVEHSNSLTMEFGLHYYYNFNPRWSLGAKLNADILRPFHTDYYLGKSTGLPVNGQLVLRRSFRK